MAIEMICVCGNKYKTLPSVLKAGYGRFCSRPCASRYCARGPAKPRPRKPIEFEIVNGCFECISHAFDLDGYPLLKRKGTMQRISRYIYTECFGEIPKGQIIRHTCDNPKCINPEHLIPGTTKENSQDMISRGRSLRGERNSSAKLTVEDVLKIRQLRSEGKTLVELGNMFGVSYTQIQSISVRKSWSHV
jgi:hypothetical protein